MSGMFWVSLGLAFIAGVWALLIISDHFARLEAERIVAEQAQRAEARASATRRQTARRRNWNEYFNEIERALGKQHDRERRAQKLGPIRSRLTTIAKAKQRKVTE